MTFNLPQLLGSFGLLDAAAIAALLLGWPLIGWLVEREGTRRSTHSLITDYRTHWMNEMVTRENRVVDVQILATLRQGAAFFTSATMIAIGGSVALLGNAEQLQEFATDLSDNLTAPRGVWEAKMLLVTLILVSAFLKFVWSHRVFGYCAVVLAAVPSDPSNPDAARFAHKAAQLNTNAARSFNRGLRAVYFALATLPWLIGPVPLLLAVSATLAVLYRREFNSQTRAALLD